MQAYNRMPDRTVETWRNMWFHTGDAGRKDSKGFVWYVDLSRIQFEDVAKIFRLTKLKPS